MLSVSGGNKPDRITAGVLGLWLLCCAVVCGVLVVYSQTPGEAGAASLVLGDTQSLDLDATRPTLVMFVHPRCPCTKASLEQLARLQRQWPDRFASRVVYTIPAGMSANWHHAVLWEQASALGDCRRIEDRGGAITRMAGAATSGTVGFYKPDGQLIFWGGLTPARGHAGDSNGSDALASYMRGQAYQDRSEIYGCPLMRPADQRCIESAGIDCKGEDG